MKKTAIILASIMASMGISNAALTQISLSAQVSAIVLADGTTPYVGPVRVGYYAGGAPMFSATSTLADMLNGFTEFAAPATDFPGFLLTKNILLDNNAPIAPGAVDVSALDPVPGLTGQQLYVVLGNDDSSRATVTNAAWDIAAFLEPPALTPSVAVGVVAGQLTYLGGGMDGDAQAGAPSSVVLGATIPEPTTGLLALVGLVGFFIRRKR